MNIVFSFTGSPCKSKENKNLFRTWAQLIYHGPARIREFEFNSSGFTTALYSTTNPPKKRASSRTPSSRKQSSHRQKRNVANKRIIKSSVYELARRRFRQRRKEQNKKWPKLSDDVKKKRIEFRYLVNALSKNTSTSPASPRRSKRRAVSFFPADSLRLRPHYPSGTIPSVEYPSKWDFQTGGRHRNIQYLQNRTIDLYSEVQHDVRFDCDRIGPAGMYSVRLITDVESSPLITESKLFRVRVILFFKLVFIV